MIERIHLRILQAVERHTSVTLAAKSLHLTQSALSHSIKKLEVNIGTPLWLKEGRGLRLTQTGRYLLAGANRILPQLERLDEMAAHYAAGEQGGLRIGMECHPCYKWLLNVVKPYLEQWPNVDIDVKQQFQFGGMAALFSHDIDILVTPDPLQKPGVQFIPVFNYEQVLVVSNIDPLAQKSHIVPYDLIDQVLFAYPVEPERLDIYTQFLLPAQCTPKKHKSVEATDIMLQMVAAGRGVAALPGWLVDEYADKLPITPVRLGPRGIGKQIFLGVRDGENIEPQINAFLAMAKSIKMEK